MSPYFSLSCGGISISFWRSVLLSMFAATTTVLLVNTTKGEGTYTVFVFFFGILVVLYSVLVDGKWGIITGGLSSTIFCLMTKLPLEISILNIIANTVQTAVLYFIIGQPLIRGMFIDKRFTINIFYCTLLSVGILHSAISVIYNSFDYVYSFAIAIFVIFVIYST